MSYTASNRRIARNTMMLYIRTFITILVSLYTSRVVLEVLGVEDYGIYNIVGGVVVLFSFITAAMTSATQRFINFELGQKSGGNVGRIFSMSMTTHIIIAVLLLLLAETVGLWFVATKINIPAERMEVVHWVYQFSVLATCVSIVRVPYNASIIAYERMGFYAYMSILECGLKLGIVYLLLITDYDKLFLYSLLMLLVIIIVTFLYKVYCNRKFSVTRYHFFWDSILFKQLISFSGWSLLGGAANVGATQGINVLLNIFYGVVVNAAMGVASQVMAAINSFVINFQVAFNPQIVKLYASGNHDSFHNLIFQTSRFSFYLAMLVVLPFIICAQPIMSLWLEEVPQYAVEFTQLLLIFVLIDALSGPLWMAGSATGRIKWFMIVTSGIRFLNLPLVYIALKLGYDPPVAIAIKVVINFATHLSRIFLLKRMIGLNVRHYLVNVMLRCIVVALIASPLPILVYMNTNGYTALVLTILVSVVIQIITVYAVGMTKNEKNLVKGYLFNKIKLR